MANLRSVGIGLLASLLVGVVGSTVAVAKKPGSDPPPPSPPPVHYQIQWIFSPSGEDTQPVDVNQSGIVVGYSSDPDVIWHAFVFLRQTFGALRSRCADR
jgi:hypothetical protein